MDASIGSVVAFRKQGSEQRRRVAAGLLAAAVVALMVVVAWRAFRDAPPEPLPTGTGTSLPDGWVRCTNAELGYSIGYPGEWHTTDVVMGEQDPSNACRWFSPTPFGAEGNVVSEGWGYPLEVATGGSIVEELLHLRVTEARVLEEEELSIDGRHAVRVEYETQLDPVAGPGLHYQYVIELDRNTTLIVHTTETRGVEGVYAENRTVVDLAVDTLIWLPARV